MYNYRNMKDLVRILLAFCSFSILFLSPNLQINAQGTQFDEEIKNFLIENKNTWYDMNVPYQDGQVLYNLIVENDYKSGLEIGTSTGHSTIWIAWAMSKTGGKVITIEIDKERQNQAIDHINRLGLSEYVDFRLADAHKLVKELKGPFDFVFSDADKGWYTNYFKDTEPKLEVGGCFTAHNVRNRYGGLRDFLDYLEKLDNYETTIDKSSSSGISISFKRGE